MATKARQVWLDGLRLTAGVSMLGLHATADPSGQPWAGYPEAQRVAPMLLRAVLYVARTELFLMISLFLLLMSLQARPRRYDEVIAVQARRLLVPFLFWTVFYAFYTIIKADAFGYGEAWRARLTDPLAWLGFLTLGSVKYHMHFLPTLFGLVLLFPLYRMARAYPVLGFSVLGLLLLKRELDGFLWSTFWSEPWLPFAVRATKILTYAGYGMAAGALLSIWQGSDARERQRWTGLILFAGAMLFLVKLVATWRTVHTGAWPFDYTPGYWADFLMPILLFALAMCLAHRHWPPLLSRLAPYSFGIYLCHPIFLDLAEIVLRDSALPPIAQVAAKIAWALPATSILVLLIARQRLLAWTIGLGPLPGIALKSRLST